MQEVVQKPEVNQPLTPSVHHHSHVACKEQKLFLCVEDLDSSKLQAIQMEQEPSTQHQVE